MTVENRSRLTSGYGYQAWRKYVHTGIDFGGVTPGRSSPVYAAADGVVEFVGWDLVPLRNGQHIGIRHPDGSLTFYGHIRYPKVRKGQHVRRGDRLADTWYTGLSASAGVHLHFEWWADADNHYSHHDPVARLAQYGWVIRGGRLHDEWDGRPTATPARPVVIKPAAPKEDTLSAAEVQQINAHTTRQADRIVTALEGIRRAVSSNSQVAAWVKDHDGTDVQTRQSLVDAETHRASLEAADLLRALVTQNGLDADQIARTTSQAITESKEN